MSQIQKLLLPKFSNLVHKSYLSATSEVQEDRESTSSLGTEKSHLKGVAFKIGLRQSL